jgi:cytochrome c2
MRSCTSRFSLAVLLAMLAGMLGARPVAAQVSVSASTTQQTQIDKGRQLAGQVCTACHTTFARMVQVHKQSPDQWRDTIYFMISRGAQVMPDEIDPLVAFLSSNAGNGRPAAAQGPGAGGPAAGGAGRRQMPAGEGRPIFQRSCEQCHDAATASNKQPSEDWAAVVARMITYGAKLTTAEQQTLTEYLNSQPK